MIRTVKLISLSILVFALSACGTLHTATPIDTSGQGSLFRRISAAIFTHASMADLQLVGAVGEFNADVATETINVLATSGNLDPTRAKQIQAAIQFAIASGIVEPVGPRVVEFKIAGETAPRLLLCKVAIAGECALMAPNGPYRVYAHPVGAGLYVVWVVDRVVKL